MTYTFETLPSRSPSFHAEKIMHDGVQVGVLLHLQASDQQDWRVFRLIDDNQINPWDIHTRQSLEQAKRGVQSIDPEMFGAKHAKTWSVVSNTAYGYVVNLHYDRDGYETQSTRPSFMKYEEALKLYEWAINSAHKGPVTPGYLAGGDFIADVALVNNAEGGLLVYSTTL